MVNLQEAFTKNTPIVLMATLEMPFDEELIGYISVADSIEHLLFWVNESDIKFLQKEGFEVIEIESDDYKFYPKFSHNVVNQKL